jgi:amino acid transporter
MVQTRSPDQWSNLSIAPEGARRGGGSVATAQVEERTLLKAMSWEDGFVVALANPGFLIAALGGSIGALGTGGAFILWSISICFGALQNNIHAELASMFPNKSGGVALYAHEAWRKYLTLIGPLATFGYWIGWSVVLAVNGLVAGTLIQAEWFSDSTWTASGAGFDLNLAVVVGMALIVIVWLFNVYGVRPAVWFGYVTGGLLVIPAFVLMFLPYITGDWAGSNLDFNIGANGGLALALVWLYFMCWSSYGIEVVATFAPEYHDTQRDTRMALRSAALFSALVYVLLPLGLGGTLGTDAVAADGTFIAFYTQAFDELVGNFLGGVMIFCIVAGLVLSMNTATMDGSRALYGISKDGMTIRQLGKLNRFRVPALAMTVDAVLNLVLISFFNNPIEIIAVSNIGYVFATCAAISGFLLLRKDRPNWPRPLKLSSIWVPIAGFCLAANLVFLVAGGFIWSGGFLGIDGYGYGWDKTRWGLLVLLLAFLLYVFRHVVQDKIPLTLREEVPQTPEEQAAHPELAPAPTAAPA